MDTGTHIVMGLALGGLAAVDPVVFNDPVTQQSVIIATVIGSQIPDIDTVLKLKNNAVYISNHRGITHSIPAVLIWPVLITLAIFPFFPEANIIHLWLWAFLAVFLHVFVDIFNAYGTQALRPFSNKWVALGVINTFDPVIFGLHLIGVIFWAFGFDSRIIFPIVYCVLLGYYLYRFYLKNKIDTMVKAKIADPEQIIINPTYYFFQWRVAVITKDKYYVVRAYRNHIEILDVYNRLPLPENEIMEAAQKDKNIAAFLSFSPVYRWEITELDEYTEVRFTDLRYRSKEHYPFVAIVHLDDELKIMSSYTGWIFNQEKLRKKLEVVPD